MRHQLFFDLRPGVLNPFAQAEARKLDLTGVLMVIAVLLELAALIELGGLSIAVVLPELLSGPLPVVLPAQGQSNP